MAAPYTSPSAGMDASKGGGRGGGAFPSLPLCGFGAGNGAAASALAAATISALGSSRSTPPAARIIARPSTQKGATAWPTRLAAIADRIHRSTTPDLPAAEPADGPAADETALFCIGAHMSGLPLNTQIVSLGGRFLRTARTTAAYRLHALGNRPGMALGDGGIAVAGEVWALPTAAIGTLLGMVPPPLGFGTVALEDGPCLGFLAEAHALIGTQDISAYGGWRAWLVERDRPPEGRR